MAEPTQPPRLDAGKWGTIARLAVAVSALLWITMAMILLLAAPPDQCPGWHLKDAHSSSLWEPLLLLGMPFNAFGCLIALRWNWFVKQAIDREPDSNAPRIPATHLVVRLCVMNSVVCQFPLFLLLTKCTPALGPGG
jgi:hypothetical protein